MQQSEQTAGTPVLHVGSIVDGYELIERLGEGGMAEVFLAHDTSLSNREVVLKVVRSGLPNAEHRAFCQRFQREADALAKAQHPHVVRVIRGGVDDDGHPFLVMERLRGESLEARLRRVGRLAPEAAVDLGLAMLDALAHLHGNGIVHRDLTSNNVMLAVDEAGCERPTLIDFGLARRDDAEGVTLTETGQVLGTPWFMAPEQARGERVDGRADLYALGVVLYRALSGAWPYDDLERGAWLGALRAGRPVVPLAERPCAVSGALAAVVHEALEANQERRYPDAATMRGALQAAATAGASPPDASCCFDGARLPARLDRYELLSELGRGGMGAVYEARHVGLDQRVAVKTLLPALARDRTARERFVREGRIAASVKHPHVVAVTDALEADGAALLVMELLEGESLRARLRARGRLTLREAADVLVPVCDAVAHANRAKVLHRDLKPGNIFLARGPQGEVPKVLDFGIAKVLDAAEPLTATGELNGSPGYIAPEVRERGSSAATPASDLYALGVILHECVAGERPQDGRVAPEAEVVGEVLRRCLAKSPDERPADAWVLMKALLPYASDGVRARWAIVESGLEATTRAHAQRGVRWRRGALAVVVLVAAVAFLWSAWRPQAESLRPADAGSSARADAAVAPGEGLMVQRAALVPGGREASPRGVDADAAAGPPAPTLRPGINRVRPAPGAPRPPPRNRRELREGAPQAPTQEIGPLSPDREAR